jgi:transcriptional regulator with XRE-family HTH domain
MREHTQIQERLGALRTALMLNWRELYERLGISERTLHYLRTGARNPSPKVLRRITELEAEAGIVSPRPVSLAVHSPAVDYTVKRERKPLDIVELKRHVAELKRQVASLERTIEEAEHANN